MAEPIYGRGTAENWISSAIKESGVTSADKYYSWLRENGQYVTRVNVRAVWHGYGEATRYTDVVSRYNPELPIPRAWYADSESEYLTKYGIRVLVTEQDPVTGESKVDSYFYRSDQYVSRNKVEEWARSLNDTTSPPILGDVTNVTIDAMYHKKGTAW